MNTPADENAMDIAVWRYGIISALLHRDPTSQHMAQMLQTLALCRYLHPNGQRVSYSAETLRKWLYRYNHGGLAGLCPRPRSDKGSHSIPASISQAMFALRKSNPRWTLAKILYQMGAEQIWNGRKPSRSCLYRFAKTHNLTRDPHLCSAQPTRPFAFDAFGQLWSADFLHGPRLYVGRHKRKAYLHVIIDDCSRYVVSGGFYRAESVETLISEMKHAIGRFGIPQRFYTDNGACYSSRHLKIVCARMAIGLVHTPPYRPQGRGKVERFFKTVRMQFLAADRSKTFAQINAAWQKYIAHYHQGLHSSLKMSPLKKRLSVENCCTELPEVANIYQLFRMQRRCRVYNNGTIRLRNRCFEVPGVRPAKRVTVYYMPWDLTKVYFGDEMTPARQVDHGANARRFEHPNRKKEDIPDE